MTDALVDRLRRWDWHFAVMDEDNRPVYLRSSIPSRSADRIEELESRLQWRPIETVPRDNTTVLLWDGEEAMAGWVNEHGEVWGGLMISRVADATHWMPLPKPPEKT